MCIDILETMEQCNDANHKQHYIVLLDGSGSITDYDFDNMLKNVESMLWFALNGQNKVTIIEFSTGTRVRCSAKTDHNQLKNCLYKFTQMNGGTDTLEAFEDALTYMADPDYKYVIALFTDGQSRTGFKNDKMKSVVESINTHQYPARILPFGIGKSVNMAELTYFGGSIGMVTEVQDFKTFETNRLQYQTKLCTAFS